MAVVGYGVSSIGLSSEAAWASPKALITPFGPTSSATLNP